jgi:F-type H+-transporting ATPase subunit b
MLIDPFTVGAQILNFLILVWLLRRLLYGPITRVMAEREARIRAEMDEASRLREEAEPKVSGTAN